MVPRAYPNE
jgi:hypothetical protein